MSSNHKYGKRKYNNDYIEGNEKLKAWVDKNYIDPVKMSESLDSQKIGDKVRALKNKVLKGKELNEDELAFLKEHSENVYRMAKDAKEERESYLETLESCQLTDDEKEKITFKFDQDISYANKIKEAKKNHICKDSEKEQQKKQ